MFHCHPFRRRYAYAGADLSSRGNSRAERRARRGAERYESRRHGRAFGVRRPLRYLSYQLDLDDSQMRRVAAILDRLKTEQEQTQLDERKTVGALAALVQDKDRELTVTELREALAGRVSAAERLQAETAKAVAEMLDVLDPDQREQLAYLLQSGQLSL